MLPTAGDCERRWKNKEVPLTTETFTAEFPRGKGSVIIISQLFTMYISMLLVSSSCSIRFSILTFFFFPFKKKVSFSSLPTALYIFQSQLLFFDWISLHLVFFFFLLLRAFSHSIPFTVIFCLPLSLSSSYSLLFSIALLSLFLSFSLSSFSLSPPSLSLFYTLLFIRVYLYRSTEASETQLTERRPPRPSTNEMSAE